MIRFRSRAVWAALLLALPAGAKEYRSFDVIGDSISAGVNPGSPGFGWVNMLFGESSGSFPARTNTIDTLWPGIQKTNSAVSGSTAADWAADWGGRLSEVKNRRSDLIVIFIGGNDFLSNLTDGFVSPSELEQYRKDLTSIITNLQDNIPVPDLVISSYYDLFDGLSTNLSAGHLINTNASSATVNGNQVIREIALSNNCWFVSGIHPAFLHHGYGEEIGDTQHLLPDFLHTPLTNFNVHPVTAGHNAICNEIYHQLEYLKNYGVPQSWLNSYGFTNYATDVELDPDHDGHATWKEYIAGTDPTNPASVFKPVLWPQITGTGNLLQWIPAHGRLYSIYCSTNLVHGFLPLGTNFFSSNFIDSAHTNAPVFYRMDVRLQ